MIHVLHIGKTGGSAVKAALRSYPDTFALHRHPVRLRDCPRGELVSFVLRHPVDRFVSSFNSRLRKGAPHYHFEWSKAEAAAFRLFSTPNQLCEALSSRNPLRRHRARSAMRSIGHVKSPLTYWLETPEYLAERKDDLLIGEIGSLQSDFNRLLRVAGIASVGLPTDPTTAHKTPDAFAQTLSDAGRENLLQWYADDVRLYQSALDLKQAMDDVHRPHGRLARGRRAPAQRDAAR